MKRVGGMHLELLLLLLLLLHHACSRFSRQHVLMQVSWPACMHQRTTQLCGSGRWQEPVIIWKLSRLVFLECVRCMPSVLLLVEHTHALVFDQHQNNATTVTLRFSVPRALLLHQAGLPPAPCTLEEDPESQEQKLMVLLLDMGAVVRPLSPAVLPSAKCTGMQCAASTL
jgi:hypothetical protein